jgi:hypothetical protein
MGRLDESQAVSRFDPGKVLGSSLGIYFRNFFGFTAVALLVNLPVLIALVWFVTKDMDLTTVKGAESANEDLMFLHWYDLAFTFVLNPLLTAALIYGVVQHLRGAHAGMRDLFAVGVRRLLPALGVGLGYGFLFGIGLVACIAPGFWLGSIYWLAVAVAVMEPGARAFDRSKALTDGVRWKVFTVIFVTFALNFGSTWLVQNVLFTDATSPTVVKSEQIVLQVLGIGFSVWNAVTTAVGYHEIRRLREGVDIAQLSAVFD